MAKNNSKGIHNLKSCSLLLFYVNVILLAKYFPCRVEGCDYMDFVFIRQNSHSYELYGRDPSSMNFLGRLILQEQKLLILNILIIDTLKIRKCLTLLCPQDYCDGCQLPPRMLWRDSQACLKWSKRVWWFMSRGNGWFLYFSVSLFIIQCLLCHAFSCSSTLPFPLTSFPQQISMICQPDLLQNPACMSPDGMNTPQEVFFLKYWP